MHHISWLQLHPPLSPTRGQMEPDKPAENGFIRKRIIPLGIQQIAYKDIRFCLLSKQIGRGKYPFSLTPLVKSIF